MTMPPRRVLNLLLLIAIAAAATYWILQFTSPAKPGEKLVSVPTESRAARTQAMDVAPIAGLFGSRQATAPSSNIKLIGVIAEGGKSQGVALLSVNNGPAMAFKVGESIDSGTALKRVKANGVVIERNGAARELVLPARQPPSGINVVK